MSGMDVDLTCNLTNVLKSKDFFQYYSKLLVPNLFRPTFGGFKLKCFESLQNLLNNSGSAL